MALRVNHCNCRRDLSMGFMMVCNNHVHTKTLCKLNLKECRNTAIHCNQQGCAVSCYTPDCLRIHSVSFVNTVRYIIVDVCSKTCENIHEDAYGRNAVHIIVTVHYDFLALFHPANYSFYRLLHILEKVRVFKIHKIRPQKRLSITCVLDSSLYHQIRHK